MSNLFQWAPLRPAGEGSRSHLTQYATAAALLVGLIGFPMVALGWAQSFWALVPLLLSALFLGLPHGAIDHLVLLGLARRKLNLKNLLLVCGLYLGAVLAILFLWWWQPSVALVLFLLYTIYHWGKADLAFECLRRNGVASGATGTLAWAHLLLRGSLPIGLPFVAFPVETRSFINRCLEPFGQSLDVGVFWQALLAGALAALLIAELFYCRMKGREGWTVGLETLGLLLFFVWVPPLLALGLYFCGWHGLRHVLRLLHYRAPGETDPVRHSPGRAFVRFSLRALPLTLLSLAMLYGIRLLVGVDSDLDGMIALYIVFISALTVPHLCVVEWMDRVELSPLQVNR